ncbi:MAG: NirA family protein [Alphaproteobacteria bacterium]|nr:NirA family protein [Alphaproteobacteria bacterium]
MTAETTLSDEQKQYLEGFLAAVAARNGGPMSGANTTPDAIHRVAQDRFVAAGKKLTPEEETKRKAHPLDRWDEIVAEAAANRAPKGVDVFWHKFFGLFYVAPAQDSFMCRLRLPNGIVTAAQFDGLAGLAEAFGGGFIDVTTRANLQIREIQPSALVELLMGIQDLGLTTRGAGADNIRNITGSPTAGVDPTELIDTRPLARALHYTILNHRELYGLPRKFNIAFDGGGQISVLEDTNDIGFAAVRVAAGAGGPPGVYFRMYLGGITGHGGFARDANVLLKPEECVAAAVAVVRVFIAYGDRTDRKRARLKYLLDDWGMDRFMAETEKEMSFKALRVPPEQCLPRGPLLKHGHIGVHKQKQRGMNYVGVVLPVGRLSASQMRGLAAIATQFGSGTIRLTVWQNVILSDISDAKLPGARKAIEEIDLGVEASPIRGALVACTGNTGCKFAATDTKAQALYLAQYLETRVKLDRPLNIHLTGCPNSCAQHYVGDIGLLGVKVAQGDDMIEGYTVVVGGGAGGERNLAREVARDVPFADVADRLEALLRTYLARRHGSESFQEFAKRHSIEELRTMFAAEPVL